MKTLQFAPLAWAGVKAVFNPTRPPLLATIILTDLCNLSCRHCAVANRAGTYSSYQETLNLMRRLKRDGVKILFFCGGEVLLWTDGEFTIQDLVRQAKKMGYTLVNVVTNGTISTDIPEADSVFVSLDGSEQAHNQIRGNTFQKIIANIQQASSANIILYMAINNLNLQEIRNVAQLAKELTKVKSISFNLHTPYAGTEILSLSREQKETVVKQIIALIAEGYPVLNLPIGLTYYLRGDWERPCNQCVVYEQGKAFTCGRCSEITGICQECGYLFAVEFSLLLQGNPRAIAQMLKVYLKYT